MVWIALDQKFFLQLCSSSPFKRVSYAPIVGVKIIALIVGVIGCYCVFGGEVHAGLTLPPTGAHTTAPPTAQTPQETRALCHDVFFFEDFFTFFVPYKLFYPTYLFGVKPPH